MRKGEKTNDDGIAAQVFGQQNLHCNFCATISAPQRLVLVVFPSGEQLASYKGAWKGVSGMLQTR